METRIGRRQWAIIRHGVATPFSRDVAMVIVCVIMVKGSIRERRNQSQAQNMNDLEA